MKTEYTIFKKDGLFGTKDQEGVVVIEPQYIEMYPFKCGFSCVRDLKYHYSYVDIDNKPLFPFGSYDWIDPYFLYGLARVKLLGKWGIINTQGDLALPLEYDNIWSLKQDYIHRIKVVKKEKDKYLDVDDLIKENLLNGLVYHKTYNVKELKAVFGISSIKIKMNTHSGKLYFEAGTYLGEVAITKLPSEPVFSIVTNVNGKLFILLHEKQDTGKENFPKFNTDTQKPITSKTDYDPGFDYEEYNQYVMDSLYDAYECEKEPDDWGF